MVLDERYLDSEVVLKQNMEHLNSFGSRTTGSKGQGSFIRWLKQELESLGYEPQSDSYTFSRWEASHFALLLGDRDIPVSAACPYSGETGAEGVTGELVLVKRGNYKKAAGKIAVVEINVMKHLSTRLVMNRRESVPEGCRVVSGDGDLVLTSVLRNPRLDKAKEAGVKGVILIWKGVSKEKVENQYLPFTDPYRGIPAIWLNEEEGRQILEATANRQSATLILEAERDEEATTESFHVSIPGKNSQETILINTHTDGINVAEENGALGLLSMIRYFTEKKPDRTLVFAFVTGHFRLPVFKGSSQATSTWLKAHEELWDGKDGHCKAVAGVTVEHLGCMEWKENARGVYGPTGDIQTEYTYTGNAMLTEIWKTALEHRTQTRSVLVRGHNKLQFGESQPLLEAGIPAIGLIQMPDYLMCESANGELDKCNIGLMREQLSSLIRAVLILDQVPKDALGESDRYSYLIGRR